MDGQNFQNNSYEQPNYQQPVPPNGPQNQGNDTLAIVSLILGIASIVLCCLWYLGLPLSIAGIVCSVMSSKKQKSGLATAGLVCSIIGIVLVVFMIILVIIGMLSGEFVDILSQYGY